MKNRLKSRNSKQCTSKEWFLLQTKCKRILFNTNHFSSFVFSILLNLSFYGSSFRWWFLCKSMKSFWEQFYVLILLTYIYSMDYVREIRLIMFQEREYFMRQPKKGNIKVKLFKLVLNKTCRQFMSNIL